MRKGEGGRRVAPNSRGHRAAAGRARPHPTIHAPPLPPHRVVTLLPVPTPASHFTPPHVHGSVHAGSGQGAHPASPRAACTAAKFLMPLAKSRSSWLSAAAGAAGQQQEGAGACGQLARTAAGACRRVPARRPACSQPRSLPKQVAPQHGPAHHRRAQRHPPPRGSARPAEPARVPGVSLASASVAGECPLRPARASRPSSAPSLGSVHVRRAACCPRSSCAVMGTGWCACIPSAGGCARSSTCGGNHDVCAAPLIGRASSQLSRLTRPGCETKGAERGRAGGVGDWRVGDAPPAAARGAAPPAPLLRCFVHHLCCAVFAWPSRQVCGGKERRGGGREVR